MNPGGIRADLTSRCADGNGDVTYERRLHGAAVQQLPRVDGPDGRADLTPARAAVHGANAGAPKVLQVSAGFTYTLERRRRRRHGVVTAAPSRSTGRRRQAAHLPDRDEQLPLRRRGRLPGLHGGHRQDFGGLDIDAFANYLTHSPYTPVQMDRITVVIPRSRKRHGPFSVAQAGFLAEEPAWSDGNRSEGWRELCP